MKTKATALVALAFTGAALAGPEDYVSQPLSDISLAAPASGFESAIRPITNPTLFDLAVPRTQVHAIFIHNQHPKFLSTSAGDIPADGDFNLFAVQLEYAFNERFSLVATKDGYIDFNPDGGVLQETEGFANLAAGVKYAFIYRPEQQYVLSGIATVEFPTGDSEVWQGRGDGALNLSLAKLKRYERLQFASALGVHIPFDDSESFTGFMSAHVSYEVSRWFIPLLELNWYHVFDEGDSSFNFDDQPVNSVASPNFEGGDLINFGSGTSSVGEDIVTIGVGFRTRLNEAATVGFAWETPLTDEEENLMDNRFTADLTWTF